MYEIGLIDSSSKAEYVKRNFAEQPQTTIFLSISFIFNQKFFTSSVQSVILLDNSSHVISG